MPPLPEALAHVLEWYLELGGRRQVTMAGPQAISFLEIDAWCRCTGIVPLPFEVSLICQLDDVYRGSVAQRMSDASRKSKSKSKGSR
jgi:hypothetical protein